MAEAARGCLLTRVSQPRRYLRNPYTGRDCLQEMDCGENHTGRTYSALRSAMFNERGLNAIEVSVRRQPLNRRNRGAVSLQCRHQTTVHEIAVDQDRTRTAFAFSAAFLDTGQAQVLAQ